MKIFLAALLIQLNLQIVHAKNPIQTVSLLVTENGFEPSEIKVKPGTRVKLKITRKTETTCATQIVIKERKIQVDLPLGKETLVDVGVLKKGDIRFACGMDMISGHIVAD
ncbi:MAG: cupredoxin domain-containing protein [Bdellovibrionales bacterium]|nr:cupredoxin domain-containing protein [Bdellovibrionales bacterium]